MNTMKMQNCILLCNVFIFWTIGIVGIIGLYVGLNSKFVKKGENETVALMINLNKYMNEIIPKELEKMNKLIDAILKANLSRLSDDVNDIAKDLNKIINGK